MASKLDLCCQTGFSWPLVIIWFSAVFALWNHPCCPRVSVQSALNLSVKAGLHPRQVANLSTIYQPTNNHSHLHSLLQPIETFLFWDSSRPALKSFLIAYSNINLLFCSFVLSDLFNLIRPNGRYQLTNPSSTTLHWDDMMFISCMSSLPATPAVVQSALKNAVSGHWTLHCGQESNIFTAINLLSVGGEPNVIEMKHWLKSAYSFVQSAACEGKWPILNPKGFFWGGKLLHFFYSCRR